MMVDPHCTNLQLEYCYSTPNVLGIKHTYAQCPWDTLPPTYCILRGGEKVCILASPGSSWQDLGSRSKDILDLDKLCCPYLFYLVPFQMEVLKTTNINENSKKNKNERRRRKRRRSSPNLWTNPCVLAHTKRLTARWQEPVCCYSTDECLCLT